MDLNPSSNETSKTTNICGSKNKKEVQLARFLACKCRFIARLFKSPRIILIYKTLEGKQNQAMLDQPFEILQKTQHKGVVKL